MQRYIKVALDSRWLDEWDWIQCDMCWKSAVDCHHINGRIWNNYDEPSWLSRLCRGCHLYMHSHNTRENKQRLLDIVKKCLKQ